MMTKYICRECGSKMVKIDEETVLCNSCHFSIEIEDYSDHDYEGYNDYNLYFSQTTDDIPDGCDACGGPWPNCIDSCNLCND